MSLKFCSFASGSSGNSYLVKSRNTALIIDTGISGKRIFEGIEVLGLEREDINGILITHEHIDHIKSLRIVTKKCTEAMVYTNIGTWQYIRDKVEPSRHIAFETGVKFTIGDIDVMPFLISHDAAEPVGYIFHHQGRQMAILTDTGVIDDFIFNQIKGADLLALEANHDPDILQFCNYPYHIKRRILGDRGHLSNEATGRCLQRLFQEDCKERQILLSHLSKENNTPEMAKITIENQLAADDICRKRMKISVLKRDSISHLYEV